MHLLVLAERAVVEELVRRLRIWVATALRPGVPLEVQRTKPLAGQSHVESAFRYVLRQDLHHDLGMDPFQDASALPDILGLRVLCPELPMRVRERLPRLTRAALLEPLGVESLEEGLYAAHLADAAMAAFALPRLGNDSASVLARRASVAAAAELGPTRIATALGVTPQAVCRLARAGADPRSVRALRLQMALRSQRPDGVAFAREAPGPAYAALA